MRADITRDILDE